MIIDMKSYFIPEPIQQPAFVEELIGLGKSLGLTREQALTDIKIAINEVNARSSYLKAYLETLTGEEENGNVS